jgi:hypothetical protein
MAKLSYSNLISLATIILVFVLAYYMLASLMLQLLAVIIMALMVSSVLVVFSEIRDMVQFLSIFIGFVGGFLLNSMLSANYLASFTKWLIQTNTGTFNLIDFAKDRVFILFAVVLVLTVLLVVIDIPMSNITKTEKLILIFFGFSVVSLILAGINFMSQLISWLSLLPVAEHWGNRVSFDSSVIMDIIKSLFLAGLFNVLERIARMSREI